MRRIIFGAEYDFKAMWSEFTHSLLVVFGTLGALLCSLFLVAWIVYMVYLIIQLFV